MEKNVTRKDLWDSAGKAGLVLGLVSIAYMVLNQLLSSAAQSTGMAVLVSLLNLILWAGKFVGCILLMKYFMKRYATAHPGLGNSDTFHFGMVTALLSALVYSAVYLAWVTIVEPDTFAMALETVTESYSSYLPQESLEAMQEINFGSTSFFVNLIYCFLYGTVLSAILSKNIPSSNPFAGEQGRGSGSQNGQ